MTRLMAPSLALPLMPLGPPAIGLGALGVVSYRGHASLFVKKRMKSCQCRMLPVAAPTAVMRAGVLFSGISRLLPRCFPSLSFDHSPSDLYRGPPFSCIFHSSSTAVFRRTRMPPSFSWQLDSKRGLLDTRPRCSQLPRLSRVYAMGTTELLQCMRQCADRRLLMRSVWEAFMYRCCVLRSTFSVHQKVQIIRIFASVQRRERCFLNYIIEEIRVKLQRLRLADGVLLLAAMQRLHLRDELLLETLIPLLIKRTGLSSSPSLLALLAYTAVRAEAPHLQELLYKIYVSMASRMNQQQETQTLALLLSAYCSNACVAVAAPYHPDGCEKEEGFIPFLPFIKMLIEAAGSSATLKRMHATDCMHLCSAVVCLTTAPAATSGACNEMGVSVGDVGSATPPAFVNGLLRRVQEVVYEFSPSELSQLLAALLHLQARRPLQQQQQPHENIRLHQGAALLEQTVTRILKEIAARAEDFSVTTAAQALKHLRMLPEPSPVTEAALLVRLGLPASRKVVSGFSSQLAVLQQVAQRLALPSSLSLQCFLPALLSSDVPQYTDKTTSAAQAPQEESDWTPPSMASAAAEMKRQQQKHEDMEETEEDMLKKNEKENESAFSDHRMPYRLPCAATVGLRFVEAIRAKGLGRQAASEATSLLAILQLRDARWAFTLLRLSPELSRSSNISSAQSLARLALGLAMLAMPMVADKTGLFALLSTRTEWPSVDGPLALLQAAALFDLTARPRSLTAEMVMPAATALYQEFQRGEISTVSSCMLGFFAASPLLTSLPSPIGSFFLSFGSQPPAALSIQTQRQSALDVADSLQRGNEKIHEETAVSFSLAHGSKREGRQEMKVASLPILKRIAVYLQQIADVHPNVCVGSWAYADMAVDLRSLALHMQLSERTEEEERNQPTEIEAPVTSGDDDENHCRLSQEIGGETEGAAASPTAGKETTIGRCKYRQSGRRLSRKEGAEAKTIPILTAPSPPAFIFSPTGSPSHHAAISPSSHLLVFILLECFDFFAVPPNLQKLGVHRTKPAILCPATRARHTALRRWGWPVVCIREKEWRDAEERDNKQIHDEGNPGTLPESHRRQLFLRLVADLATQVEKKTI